MSPIKGQMSPENAEMSPENAEMSPVKSPTMQMGGGDGYRKHLRN